MKLLTHNMLICSKKTCNQAGSTAYPLRIKAVAVEKAGIEFNPDFLVASLPSAHPDSSQIRMLPKLDWPALVRAAGDISVQIPPALPPNAAQDEAFLRNLHTVLLDLIVKEGELICPNCSRSFPIKDGVPNLLLNENEV